MNRATPNWRRVLGEVVPPIALFLALLSVWEVVVRMADLPAYLLPAPSAIATAVGREPGTYAVATLLTGAAAVCGFVASLVAGTAVGLVFSQSRIVRSSGYPYALFLQTVPIVAIAPLIVIWFGNGFHSVVLVAFVVSLFPVIASATAGLVRIDPNLLDLFQLQRATRWQTLWKLRLPHAVPAIVVGAKTSAGASVIGAIVGEFFTGSRGGVTGLGYLIDVKKDLLRIDGLFAAVGCCTLLGIVIFATVNGVGARILRTWYDARGEPSA